MFVTVYLLGAVSFLICRSYRDNAMAIGEIISWLDCTVESKVYLTENDVEKVLDGGCIAVTLHIITSVNLTY